MHGDIPEEHRQLVEELLDLEDYFDSKIENIKPNERAKGFVCISHDFYQMGDDDKGSDLLIKANVVCPGYFDNEMKEHVAKSPDFAALIQSLSNIIFNIAKSTLEQKK